MNSGELVKLCAGQLGWKNHHLYGNKKLCDKGYITNENAVVSVVIPRERVQKEETEYFVERTFGGSLPQFVAAFLGGKTLSEKEAESIKALIDAHKEE